MNKFLLIFIFFTFFNFLNSQVQIIESFIKKTPTIIEIDNKFEDDIPIIYIVGLPSENGIWRWAKGIKINGERVTERMLSESVLILYPNKTGKWGYNTGFDIFRMPIFKNGIEVNPRDIIEYKKYKYDVIEKVNVVGGDMNLVLINRPNPSLKYEIKFPESIKVKNFRVYSNCDQIKDKDVKIIGKIIKNENVVQEKVIEKFPVEFSDLNISEFIFEIFAETKKTVGLYYTTLESDLDIKDLKLPLIKKGKNRIEIEDDDDSSHNIRVIFKWNEKPEKEKIFEDFEEKEWSGGFLSEDFPFTGKKALKIKFQSDKDFQVYKYFLQSIDLSKYNSVGVAIRKIRSTSIGAILLGIKNEDTNYQYVRLKAEDLWNFQKFDISNFKRDKVKSINIYFSSIQGFEKQEINEYEIDTLCFFEESVKKEEKKLSQKILNYNSPYEKFEIKKKEIPDIKNWFSLGIYDGILSRDEKEAIYLLDQMKKFNMNSVYVSNGSIDGLRKILPHAEKRGIRLIYQGSGPSSLYYWGRTKQERLNYLEKEILPNSKKYIPEFKNYWAIAGWSLVEEIPPEYVEELTSYYNLVREISPEQPPTVLHNNLKSAELDLKINKPKFITHDFYPFFWSPKSGPSNPTRSLNALISHISSYYKICEESNANLWMMLQSYGGIEEVLDPPYYGYQRGMRDPSPGEIKLQTWVSIAEGAKGIFYYFAQTDRKDVVGFWDSEWNETDKLKACGEVFKNILKVAPLLVKIKRNYKEKDIIEILNGKVIANSFIKEDGEGNRYIIIASLDGFKLQEFNLKIKIKGEIFDMIERKKIDKLENIKLSPGEGKIFAIGEEKFFKEDLKMIDLELEKYYK